MFDGSEDTCWNSDQGSSQFILVDFGRRVQVDELQIMFQGGFVGQSAAIDVGGGAADAEDEEASAATSSPFSLTLTPATKLEVIDDSNDLQKFSFSPPLSCRVMKITFQSSTDFYGRVTIYKLVALGRPTIL